MHAILHTFAVAFGLVTLGVLLVGSFAGLVTSARADKPAWVLAGWLLVVMVCFAAMITVASVPGRF